MPEVVFDRPGAAPLPADSTAPRSSPLSSERGVPSWAPSPTESPVSMPGCNIRVGSALVNTLVMAALEGRDELVLLLRVGATVRQLVAKAAWEAASAALVGVAAASAAVVGVTKALTGSWAPSIPAASVAVIVGIAAALTSLATIVPVTRALRAGETR